MTNLELLMEIVQTVDKHNPYGQDMTNMDHAEHAATQALRGILNLGQALNARGSDSVASMNAVSYFCYAAGLIEGQPIPKNHAQANRLVRRMARKANF